MQIERFLSIGHLLTHFRPMFYFTVKPDSWFRLTKYMENTIGRVSDLNL